MRSGIFLTNAHKRYHRERDPIFVAFLSCSSPSLHRQGQVRSARESSECPSETGQRKEAQAATFEEGSRMTKTDVEAMSRTSWQLTLKRSSTGGSDRRRRQQLWRRRLFLAPWAQRLLLQQRARLPRNSRVVPRLSFQSHSAPKSLARWRPTGTFLCAYFDFAYMLSDFKLFSCKRVGIDYIILRSRTLFGFTVSRLVL